MQSKVCMAFVTLFAAGLCAAQSPQQNAGEILANTGVEGGLVAQLGCGDGKLTAALRVNDSYLVHGLDSNSENVEKARRYIQSKGLYGDVSVSAFDGRRLPYTDNLVNLLIVDEEYKLSRDEMLRVLAPGGVLLLDGKTVVKPRPDDIDEWPQYLHGADNNAVARDSVVGPPRHMQWVDYPRWSRSHMNIPSLCSLVSAGGRLFTIEDRATPENPLLPSRWHLVARDAFNGIVLWKHRIPEWDSNTRYVKDMTVQLQRRTVAVDDILYCVPKNNAPVTKFDAATGEILKVYENTKPAQEILHHDGVLYAVVGEGASADRYNIVKPERNKGINLGGGDPEAPFGGTGFRRHYAAKVFATKNPKSEIVAVDASSGKELWRTKQLTKYIAASLCAKGDAAAYMAGGELVCVDAKTGEERWSVKRDGVGDGTAPPTVVMTDELLLCASPHITAFSLKDGLLKWGDAKGRWNIDKGPDLFVVGDRVWTGGTGVPKSYDLKTGKRIDTLSQKQTRPMGHDRCYRNFITEKFYINSKTGGADFLKLDGSGEFPNHWTRGTCGMGVVPANGLLYVPPFSCQCSMGAMINSFNALYSEPGMKRSDKAVKVEPRPRLIKGPAYGGTSQSKPADAPWPTYRHDITRGGSSQADVPANLKPAWKVKLAGYPSAPVIADGKVFISDVDANTLYALDLSGGREIWTYIAGGRVDSPPTYYKGLLLFGSRDGWMHCISAKDGELAWKFKDLPDKLICAYGRLESAWPVHGSVLVKDDIAYFCAGRSSFLDGGIFLYGLNPLTGQVVHRGHQYGPFNKNTGFPDVKDGFTSDVFVADEKKLYLRHKAYNPNLSASRGASAHIVAAAGFLDGVPQHRTYWSHNTGNQLTRSMETMVHDPNGDIMVADGRNYYAIYGFSVHRHSYFDPRVRGYKLVAGPLKGDGKRHEEKKRKAGWSTHVPITGNAMIKAGENLFIAGKRVQYKLGMFKEIEKGYYGASGGVLWVASAAAGEKLAQYELDAAPAWDGMAAANGKLIIALRDGTIECLEPKE